MHAPWGGVEFVGHWPLQCPVESISQDGLLTESIVRVAGVVEPTAAVGAPYTQAPSEREDKEKGLGRGPPSAAATCSLDTSPTNSGCDARVAPRAHMIASQSDKVATV